MERGRYAFNVEVEREGKKFFVSPVMFQDGESGSLIRNPDVVNLLTKDFYVSPISLESGSSGHSEDLVTVTETKPVQMAGMEITYLGYTVEKGTLTAKLKISKEGVTEMATLLMKNMASENIEFIPVTLSTGISLTISKINPNPSNKSMSSVTVKVDGLHDHSSEIENKPDTLVIEASIKPYINLVWIGTFILIIGFLITIIRRGQEALRNESWK